MTVVDMKINKIEAGKRALALLSVIIALSANGVFAQSSAARPAVSGKPAKNSGSSSKTGTGISGVKVLKNGVWTEIAPTVKKDDGTQLYFADPGTSFMCWVACPNDGWYFSDSFSNDTKRAGHNHTMLPTPPLTYNWDGEPQMNTLSQTLVSPQSLGANSKSVYYLQLPNYATSIRWTTQWYGSCSDTAPQAHIIEVKVDGLEPLNPDTAHYKLVQEDVGNPRHPYNHYGTAEMNDAIVQIAAAYNAACPGSDVLEIGDMSLPWGGLFDVNGDWNKPYAAHGKGRAANIMKQPVKKADREKLIRIMCGKMSVVQSLDGAGQTPHYQIGSSIEDGDCVNGNCDDDAAGITSCCVAPNAAIPQKCIDD